MDKRNIFFGAWIPTCVFAARACQIITARSHAGANKSDLQEEEEEKDE
jgi:hypothetical protein